MLNLNSDIPIQKIQAPEIDLKGIELYLRREDLNHPLVSGNKLRKLKYNLEEAKNQNKDTLLTFGGAFSNHILATAAAGKELGMKTIGVIRGEEMLPLNPTLTDSHSYGMHLAYLDRSSYRNKNEDSLIQSLRDKFGDFYLIPEGGTNALALPGVREIMDWEAGTYTHICCPVGTGGTLAGLISGAREGEQFLGFSALKNALSLEEDVRLLSAKEKGCWNINHEFHFGGYAKAPKTLLDFILDFEGKFSIPLEPIYTGKMMWGILDLISKDYFKVGSKILAIHTGGLQGRRGFDYLAKQVSK